MAESIISLIDSNLADLAEWLGISADTLYLIIGILILFVLIILKFRRRKPHSSGSIEFGDKIQLELFADAMQIESHEGKLQIKFLGVRTAEEKTLEKPTQEKPSGT